ncbi:MAG: ROK family protein [Streptococcaceae bacterium]|jgi:predicted NBD/HSP70 family sugar kinase|nr:ROK family protein [Streptococcaceae bacterium]
MILAFDIGGTSVKYGLVDDVTGEITEKSSFKTPVKSDELLSNLTEVKKNFEKRGFAMSGIGIAAPGCVSRDGVMTTFGMLYEMYGLPLRERLSNLTGLPVVVENDANAAAIAEKWLGNARELEDYLVVTLGTGVGGGIVSGGRIFRGAHGFAGEFGSQITNGLTRIGELEEISQLATSSAVTGLLRSYNAAQKSVTHGQAQDLSEARDVIARVEAGDALAATVFDIYLENVSVGLMNLFALFDPEAILIGGGISASSTFMDSLSVKFDSLITRHFGLNAARERGILGHLTTCALKNDAGLIGAAYGVKLAG